MKMARCIIAPWIRYGCVAAIFCSLFVSQAKAQRFAEAGFRSFPLQTAPAEQVEQSLREFLAQHGASGQATDVVSDQRNQRVLVRGSDDVLQAVGQFIQTIDRPSASQPFAEVTRSVRGYPINDPADLNQRLVQFRQQFEGRADVRIAADQRTRQLVVHAPADVHNQIADSMKRPSPPLVQQKPLQPQETPAASRPSAPARFPNANAFGAAPAPSASRPLVNSNEQLRLEHINWQGLLQGMRGVPGLNAAITSPQEGKLEMQLPSPSGLPVNLRIDQQNQVVQISGDEESTQNWTRVIQAMDQQPANASEQQAMGRLGDAKAGTITQTIAMLGGAGRAQPLRAVPQRGVNGLGQGIANQLFQPQNQRAPMQLAQANPAPAGGDGGGETSAAGLLPSSNEEGGSFLGPVRIEFVEGTDIFIVRGQKRDVDRVMQIINNIEELTAETEPKIEIVDLDFANSEAVAALINELNAGVLQARQGDVSITALVKPNAVLLIGREAGVDAVKEIIKKLDVDAEASARFKVFPLKFLPAVDAERTINFLYNQQQTQQAVGATATGATLNPRVRAVADFRSNSIVVQGSPRDIEEIGELLTQIDQKEGSPTSEVRIFPLKNAIAEEIATVLDNTLGTEQGSQGQGQGGQNQGQTGGANGTANTQASSSRRAMTLQMKVLDEKANKLLDNEVLESGILSNVVVSFNERTNSVIVTAPVGSMDLIAEIIRQLDEGASQEAEIRVFTNINGDAQTLVDMLDGLFPQDQGQDGVLLQSAAGTSESTLVPLRFALDPRTNSIISTGNEADLQVVEAILLKLDANDANRRKTFVYELLNQEASAVADAITQYVLQKRDAITSIAPDTLSVTDLIDQEIVVVAENNSNKVIVSVSDRYFDEVMQLLRDLDKRPEMVMVKCLIAEVTLNSTEEFGVELGIQDSLLFNRSVIDTATGAAIPGFNFNNQQLGGNQSAAGAARDQVAGQALSNFSLGRTNSELGYGGLVLSASNESVSVLLRALQEARRLDVLSRPQVMMLNNTLGEVQVGSSVPFIQDSQITNIGTTNTVDFEDVGLILSVTPRISPDGLVVLNVLADKSELGSIEDGIPISISASGQVLRQPIINRTRAQTFVSARDGQTVILGGLITKDRAAFERKVPYLADIPLLGKLFKTEGVAESRKELLIILTPHIVRDETDINQINSEEYARMSWCLGNVIETYGDIGPSGYEEMTEEQMIYSQFAGPGESVVVDGPQQMESSQQYIETQPAYSPEAMQNPPGTNYQGVPIPQSVPPQSLPSLSPTPMDTMPQPMSPPLPGIPQAQRNGFRLNAPLSNRGSNKISRVAAASSTAGEKNNIKTLGHVDERNDGSKSERALFRLEELPQSAR